MCLSAVKTRLQISLSFNQVLFVSFFYWYWTSLGNKRDRSYDSTLQKWCHFQCPSLPLPRNKCVSFQTDRHNGSSFCSASQWHVEWRGWTSDPRPYLYLLIKIRIELSYKKNIWNHSVYCFLWDTSGNITHCLGSLGWATGQHFSDVLWGWRRKKVYSGVKKIIPFFLN